VHGGELVCKSSLFMTKIKYRKLIRKKRSILENKNKLDKIIQNNFLELFSVSEEQNYTLYLSTQYEVSTDRILKTLNQYKKNIFLPKLVKDKLKFNAYDCKTNLRKNKFNIREIDNHDYIDIKNINTFVIPCLGVDVNGFRLGYGGGFYDKALSSIKNNKKVNFIGLAYDYQVLDESFGESHDIKYDLVITENKIIKY